MGKKDKGGADEKPTDSAENIKVIVRCRPLNGKETEAGYKPCVDLDLSEGTVTVHTLCGNPDRWTFDAVINNTYTQKDVFTQFVRPMVDSVLDGFNATVFAYGQSGSGKTHTMTGKMGDPELEGIIPRTFAYVFAMLRQFHETSPNKRFSLYVSFIELYNGKVRDLLAKQQVPLAVKENKDKTFYVQGAHFPQVKTPEDILQLMEEGTERRQVAATELNADSSRSHSVFTLVVECTETTDDGDVRSVTSKLNLVDLAGSERQSKTGATGDTLKEGCNINLSLSALGTVIDTLVKGKGHVPFRSSPLTMLLKDSLGGSSKTAMFANIGPSEHNISETISTLRFADRAKQIKNKPVVNMDTKDQKIAELTELVAELREKLKQFESGGLKELEQENESLKERVGELEVEYDNAVKGREADTVDFGAQRDQWKSERDQWQERLDETSMELERLRESLAVAESVARDETRQRDEIFQLCTEFLVLQRQSAGFSGTPITNVDELARALQDVSHGANSVEMTKMQSAAHQLEVEKRALEQAMQLQKLEFEQQLEAAKSELAAVSKKLKKSKDMLEEERHARKQYAAMPSPAAGVVTTSVGGPSSVSPLRRSGSLAGVSADAASPPGAAPSQGTNAQTVVMTEGSAVSAVWTTIASEENASWLEQRQTLLAQHQGQVQQLQQRIQEMYDAMESNAEVKRVEQEREALRAQYEDRVSQIRKEVDALRSAATADRDDDSSVVRHLKHVIATQQEASAKQQSQMESLQSLVDSLKANQHALQRQMSLGGMVTTVTASAPATGPGAGTGRRRNPRSHHAAQRPGAPPTNAATASAAATTQHDPANSQQAADALHAAGDEPTAADAGGVSPAHESLGLDMIAAQLHREERDSLRRALDVTAQQRNDLLECLINGNVAQPSGAGAAPGGKRKHSKSKKHPATSSSQLPSGGDAPSGGGADPPHDTPIIDDDDANMDPSAAASPLVDEPMGIVSEEQLEMLVEELRRLKEENERYRREFLVSQDAIEEKRFEALFDAAAKEREAIDAQERIAEISVEAAQLKARLIEMQHALETTRRDMADKEAFWISKLTVGRNGPSGGQKKRGNGGRGGRPTYQRTADINPNANSMDDGGAEAVSDHQGGEELQQGARRLPETPREGQPSIRSSRSSQAGMVVPLTATDVTISSSQADAAGSLHEQHTPTAYRDDDGDDDVDEGNFDETAESPLKSLVDLLQREKGQLLHEVGRLERELLLRAMSTENGASSTAAAAVARSQDATATSAADAGSDKNATVRRDSSMAALLKLDEEQRRANASADDLRARFALLEVEHSQAHRDLDVLKGELDEERQRHASMDQDKKELMETLRKVQSQLAETDLRCAQIENTMHEKDAEVQRVLSSAADHTRQVEALEARLSERSEQLTELRNTLTQQRASLQKANERMEEAAAQNRELQKQLSERDRVHAQNLAEREEAVLRATNRRIEALAEEHQHDLARKDEEAQRLKKKMRKLEAQLQKSKEKFDEKVCELDDISKRLEEQKVEAMRLLLKAGASATVGGGDALEVHDQQEAIQSSLARAKEEQRRKKDKFAMGESTSALSQVRAAGNAINLVKKMGQVVAQPQVVPTSQFQSANAPTHTSGSGDPMDDYYDQPDTSARVGGGKSSSGKGSRRSKQVPNSGRSDLSDDY